MSRLFGSKYKNLIYSGSNQKSEFNTDPGVGMGIYKTKNPYSELIKNGILLKQLLMLQLLEEIL